MLNRNPPHSQTSPGEGWNGQIYQESQPGPYEGQNSLQANGFWRHEDDDMDGLYVDDDNDIQSVSFNVQNS